MDIGSAKILPEEMEGIPHYLVDVLEPEEEFHVARFQQMAKEAMEEIWAQGRIPVLTGGTGFYIQALLKNVDFSDSFRGILAAAGTGENWERKLCIRGCWKKIRKRRKPFIPTTASG